MNVGSEFRVKFMVRFRVSAMLSCTVCEYKPLDFSVKLISNSLDAITAPL